MNIPLIFNEYKMFWKYISGINFYNIYIYILKIVHKPRNVLYDIKLKI